MKTNLQKLIVRVSESKGNIEDLEKLEFQHEENKRRHPSGAKLHFYVSGHTERNAKCIDERIFLNAIKAAIESEKAIMSDDYKTLEAMELLASKNQG